MMPYKINSHALRWINMVEKGEIVACKEQKRMVKYVRECFESEDIYTDDEQLTKYLGLSRYFPYDRLFEWEAFCIALHLCTFWRETGRPRWPDLLIMIGRGAGKDGYIALEGLCLISPHSKLPAYDVDICANAEEQAMRPVADIISVLDDAKNNQHLRQYFKWTKEQIIGLKLKGVIKGRTSNPKSKDGMRSGIVIFNELHQYSDYKNIKVFITGLGKKKHPRRLYATTNGDVREGPLDELLARSERILFGEEPDNGFLPFICRLDDKKESDNPEMWPKANPSLPYLPDLQTTIEKEYADWKSNPVANPDFMTKRMNLPQTDTEVAITDYDKNVKGVTARPLPDLIGWDCVCGIDFASISDFASVNLHFRDGDMRYDINHSWLCSQSKDLHRISAPWREWAAAGYITIVDDVEIHPDMLCEWIADKMIDYNIKKVAIDNHRTALFKRSLAAIGFDTSDREVVKMVRPSDIMRVYPVIESVFNNHFFIWGDSPVLRWCTNNTKYVRSSRNIGSDTGNFYFAKIEAKSRKNDAFMALVHAFTVEDILDDSGRSVYDALPVIL